MIRITHVKINGAWLPIEAINDNGEHGYVSRVRLSDGIECYGKSWKTWFPDEGFWRIVRVGAGAYGTGYVWNAEERGA
jgi:hypothetical protein